MKKLFVLGMLLGLLTSLSFAQRGRAVGMGPTARGPIGANVGPMSPSARINPNAVTVGHDGISPNAKPIEAPPGMPIGNDAEW